MTSSTNFYLLALTHWHCDTTTMKIAITGCNGKVGQRVALLALKQGHSVRGIDNAVVDRSGGDHEFINTHEHFAFIKADLRKYDDVLKALEGCIGVVHLAGLPNPTDGVAATHNRCEISLVLVMESML